MSKKNSDNAELISISEAPSVADATALVVADAPVPADSDALAPAVADVPAPAEVSGYRGVLGLSCFGAYPWDKVTRTCRTCNDHVECKALSDGPR